MILILILILILMLILILLFVTNALYGSEDYLVSDKTNTLVEDEMAKLRKELITS